MQCFQNALAYLAAVVSYVRKMFMKLTLGCQVFLLVVLAPLTLQGPVLLKSMAVIYESE